MAKTLAALETEVRSQLDALAPAARARWRTLRVLRGVARVVIFAAAMGAAIVAWAGSGLPLVGVVAGMVFLSVGYGVDKLVCGLITLVAVKGAVRALEQAHDLGSIGGTSPVALPPPTRSARDRDRTFPAPRAPKVRAEAADRDARDFDDAG